MTTTSPRPSASARPGRARSGPGAAAPLRRSAKPAGNGNGAGFWSSGTTPGWYRRTATLGLALIVAAALASTVAGVLVRGSSAAIESNSAPSSIAVQDLFAAVAEADAAATAVFLSGATGTEDRVRRNLYLDALARAAEQTEEVARLVGDDDQAHEALQTISVGLVTYSGRIEASRAANRTGSEGAEEQLQAALDLSQRDIASALAVVTARAQEQLNTDRDTGRWLMVAAGSLSALALGAVIWMQHGYFRRSNRLLNLPLVVAAIALAGLLVLLIGRQVTRSTALDNANSGGYVAIAATSELQSSTFALQSELSLRLIGTTGAGTDVADLMTSIEEDIVAIEATADSAREEAAAAELTQRWRRYRANVEDITALANSGDTDEAIDRFQGPGLSTFNGVNTSLESVLSDNRTQFSTGVAQAARSVRLLPWYSLVLTALAALGVVLGAQQRLGDYR